MYSIGLDVDTRAYFTAATCATSLFKPLSVNTPSKFFSKTYFNKNLICNSVSTLTSTSVTTSTEITLWGNQLGISSMFPKSKLTKLERNQIELTPNIKSILVGILLSDAWLQKREGWNPRIGFKQSIGNFEYLWYVFNLISVLCSNFPYNCQTRGKLFYDLQFETRQLDCLNEIYNLFYKSQPSLGKNIKNIKCVKPELFEYLDYIALAHWIQGDGAKKNKGITLCTDNFTIQEVVLLMNILLIKFDIKSTIHKEKNYYRIYINNSELSKIIPYIKPYFTTSSLYKLSVHSNSN